MKIFIKNNDGITENTVVVKDRLAAIKWCRHHSCDKENHNNPEIARRAELSDGSCYATIDIRKFHTNKVTA